MRWPVRSNARRRRTPLPRASSRRPPGPSRRGSFGADCGRPCSRPHIDPAVAVQRHLARGRSRESRLRSSRRIYPRPGGSLFAPGERRSATATSRASPSHGTRQRRRCYCLFADRSEPGADHALAFATLLRCRHALPRARGAPLTAHSRARTARWEWRLSTIWAHRPARRAVQRLARGPIPVRAARERALAARRPRGSGLLLLQIADAFVEVRDALGERLHVLVELVDRRARLLVRAAVVA